MRKIWNISSNNTWNCQNPSKLTNSLLLETIFSMHIFLFQHFLTHWHPFFHYFDVALCLQTTGAPRSGYCSSPVCPHTGGPRPGGRWRTARRRWPPPSGRSGRRRASSSRTSGYTMISEEKWLTREGESSLVTFSDATISLAVSPSVCQDWRRLRANPDIPLQNSQGVEFTGTYWLTMLLEYDKKVGSEQKCHTEILHILIRFNSLLSTRSIVGSNWRKPSSSLATPIFLNWWRTIKIL